MREKMKCCIIIFLVLLFIYGSYSWIQHPSPYDNDKTIEDFYTGYNKSLKEANKYLCLALNKNQLKRKIDTTMFNKLCDNKTLTKLEDEAMGLLDDYNDKILKDYKDAQCYFVNGGEALSVIIYTNQKEIKKDYLDYTGRKSYFNHRDDVHLYPYYFISDNKNKYPNFVMKSGVVKNQRYIIVSGCWDMEAPDEYVNIIEIIMQNKNYYLIIYTNSNEYKDDINAVINKLKEK